MINDDYLPRVADRSVVGEGLWSEALIVVVGLGSAAYRRKDGVYVVQITALKP